MAIRAIGRDFIKAVVDSTGVTNVRSVSIEARYDDVAIMTIERIMSDDDVKAIAPYLSGVRLNKSTTVIVDENTRVTFNA